MESNDNDDDDNLILMIFPKFSDPKNMKKFIWMAKTKTNYFDNNGHTHTCSIKTRYKWR